MTHCRDARPEDLTALLALYRQLSPEDPPLLEDEARPQLEALLASGMTHLLIAEADGMVAGTCLLVIIPNLTRGGRPFAIIENVVTHAGVRRRGVATALLKTAQERAWSANCYKLMLATGRSEEGVLRFYEQAGFTRGGKTFFEIRQLG
jgi:GNAT superfamily N-acetyltransferase